MAPAAVLLLPNFLLSPPPSPPPYPRRTPPHGPSPSPPRPRRRTRVVAAGTITCCATRGGTGSSSSSSARSRAAAAMPEPVLDSPAIDCIGTGADVECFANEDDGLLQPGKARGLEVEGGGAGGSEPVLARGVLEWALLVSPFFFWGTAMVAMKEVIPKAGPFFVSAFRLVPAGLMLVGFAGVRGRRQPSGFLAWLSIFLFGIVDATCFQGFLAEGLQKTPAGLGSVIIDSQPLTVSILAALLFGESIGMVGAAGLAVGVIGLLLLEVPALEENSSTIWGSGEWWMLLAAQSMAVGTVMIRWVSKYSDPVMATGWHMIIGGLPLLAVSILNHDPALSGGLVELTSSDLLALLYTSVFGSAISYGVYFYNATRGSLTKLSSLTFLTPMFASIFGVRGPIYRCIWGLPSGSNTEHCKGGSGADFGSRSKQLGAASGS